MIIPIKEINLEQLGSLYTETFNAPPWNETWKQEWAIDRLSILINSPCSSGFAYVESGELIGAILGRGLSYKGKKEFDIDELFIKPDKQRKGIATKLLNHLLDELKLQNISKITLVTSKKVDAFKFYEKQGFKTFNNLVLMHNEI